MSRVILFSLLLFAISCKTNKVYHLADIETTYLYFDKENNEIDTLMDNMIAPFRAELSQKMDVVLIQNEKALKKGRPNCNLGHWITDMQMDYIRANGFKADFSIQNYGGLRVNSLGAGAITIGDIYQVMPFENMLVILTTKGDVVQALCDHIAGGGGWPISKELEFTKENDKAVDIKINGKPLDLNQTYTYAVPDYIANGGSDCSFLVGIEQLNTGKLIRDIMLEETKKRGAKGETLNISKENRIHE